ncbi:hypothetical protein BJ322DRAFT_1071526 [Thelephora terrestris]|uniref:DUF6533 domain-containing protein n=1 Tax=Thelephora terrestris TaxID=56493 RepID=A0A9P6L5Y4_9AGAM|nr:hypothetical protein BJ322DRAFT_1071508 [Thelephora terrestris]KAF9783528.1 hypothetical protein BJ322DRAFT_1071526 [Thelephora terrestris]
MPSIDEVVQIGHDVTSLKCYWLALSTILFYDYLLTLQDELRYIWKGKKSWAFGVFFVNRYLPMAYAIWIIASNLLWDYTYEMCARTAFVEVLFFVWCTLIAQVVLSARLYAITIKNKIIAGLLLCIIIPQFLLGIWRVASVMGEPVQRFPDIDLTAYQICVFARSRKAEIAYTAISLCYDLLAFLVIVVFAVKAGFMDPKFRGPRIIRAIVQDATVYFLFIFTSHFVFEMTLLFARPNLQLLPGSGNYVFLPVMIGRLMLSLKKAADPSNAAWSLASITISSRRERPASECSHNTPLAPGSTGAPHESHGGGRGGLVYVEVNN